MNSSTFSDLDDKELMKLLVQGNEEAFIVIYKRHYKKVCALIKQLLRDVYTGNEPEDIAEEVFETIIKKADKFDPNKASFNTWIMKIVSNKCDNERQRNIFRRILHLGNNDLEERKEKEEESSYSIDGDVIKQEHIKFLDECMKELPEKLKFILIMHYYEDMTYEDIGKILGGVAKTTICDRANRATDMLRDCLKKKGVEI